MYVTAHRVQRGGSNGINTFLHVHGASPSPIDWRRPDVRAVAETHPGAFVVQRTEVPPGNNAVLSYFDVVVADGNDINELLGSIERTGFPGHNGDIWYDGQIGYRYYCSQRLPDPSREFEILKAHVRLLAHRARGRLQVSSDASLVIEVRNDDTGIKYRLDDASRQRVAHLFPQATPATIGVFFENREALIQMWGESAYHTEIAKAVTGLDDDDLVQCGGVRFRDEFGQLSPASDSVLSGQRMSGQIDGFWYGPGEAIPRRPPSADATGAILRRNSSALALVLIPLEFFWYPISEAAIYTYRHTTGMQNGERWTFVAKNDGQRFTCRLATSLRNPAELGNYYGAVAASRARPDQATVQIEARPEP